MMAGDLVELRRQTGGKRCKATLGSRALVLVIPPSGIRGGSDAAGVALLVHIQQAKHLYPRLDGGACSLVAHAERQPIAACRWRCWDNGRVQPRPASPQMQ